MVKLKRIVDFLDELLDIRAVPEDPSNNGLQVQGNEEVERIVFGVDISLDLIERGIEENSSFIFVHHGLSWGSSLKYITGSNSMRLTPMLKNGISLYGAHLPLDKHPELGHNAILSDMIGLASREPFFRYDGVEIGFIGFLEEAMSIDDLRNMLCFNLKENIKENRSSFLSEFSGEGIVLDHSSSKKVQKIAIVSGGAGTDCVLDAISVGAECLITGEFTHTSYFLAKEAALSIIAPGHYLTETPGVISVMHEVKKAFPEIETEFIDLPTNL